MNNEFNNQNIVNGNTNIINNTKVKEEQNKTKEAITN